MATNAAKALAESGHDQRKDSVAGEAPTKKRKQRDEKGETNDEGSPQDDAEDMEADAVKHAAANDDKDKDPQEKSPPLSKNQRKKRLRWEKAMERKARQKQHEKEAKRARAKAEGRDLDAERRLQEERTLSGEGHRRREQLHAERWKAAEKSFQVCIDCAFEDSMTPKEVSSLALQIRYAYATNKRSPNPCLLSAAQVSGATEAHLQKVAGFPHQWEARGFRVSSQSLVHLHPDKTRLVYLTSDAPHLLQDLDDSKIYVIGGIVDRNRLRRATLQRAQQWGVATARLPLDGIALDGTRVLTCNHVFDILLKYRQYGKDWSRALLEVLPPRKELPQMANHHHDKDNEEPEEPEEEQQTDDTAAKEEEDGAVPSGEGAGVAKAATAN